MTMKILNTIDNRNNLEVEEKHKRDEVLEYENIIFNIVKQKQEGNEYQRALSQSRTLQNQKENQFKLKEFKKIMNSLQDESICNKNDKQRRIMYNEKVKKELEEKRKEEEKRLENRNKAVDTFQKIIEKDEKDFEIYSDKQKNRSWVLSAIIDYYSQLPLCV